MWMGVRWVDASCRVLKYRERVALLELGTKILAFVNLVFAGGIKGSAH